jgi:hypothetical protein
MQRKMSDSDLLVRYGSGPDAVQGLMQFVAVPMRFKDRPTQSDEC